MSSVRRRRFRNGIVHAGFPDHPTQLQSPGTPGRSLRAAARRFAGSPAHCRGLLSRGIPRTGCTSTTETRGSCATPVGMFREDCLNGNPAPRTQHLLCARPERRLRRDLDLRSERQTPVAVRGAGALHASAVRLKLPRDLDSAAVAVVALDVEAPVVAQAFVEDVPPDPRPSANWREIPPGSSVSAAPQRRRIPEARALPNREQPFGPRHLPPRPLGAYGARCPCIPISRCTEPESPRRGLSPHPRPQRPRSPPRPRSRSQDSPPPRTPPAHAPPRRSRRARPPVPFSAGRSSGSPYPPPHGP